MERYFGSDLNAFINQSGTECMRYEIADIVFSVRYFFDVTVLVDMDDFKWFRSFVGWKLMDMLMPEKHGMIVIVDDVGKYSFVVGADEIF